MQSIKPAPETKKTKKIPLPELSVDEDDQTEIEVEDYRKPNKVQGIKETVMEITKLSKYSHGKGLETI